MAKNIFRSMEIQVSPTKVHISPPVFARAASFAERPVATLMDLDDLDDAEEMTPVPAAPAGPSPEEMENMRTEFLSGLEAEREELLARAREEAGRIVKEAEQVAFDEVQRKGAQAQESRNRAEQEAADIVSRARTESEAIVQEGSRQVEELHREAREKGFEEGRVQGWQEGKTEADRLVDRLHVIVSKSVERRNEIIGDSEAQLVALVLNIARKVVKVLSENQRNVVVNNVVQALRKLKSKSDVIIRVNMVDLKITSEHMKELTDRIERLGNVQLLEDATVDPGGCIIETDFGEIDARISSQLQEIEDKILEITPIRTRQRDPAS